MGDWFGGVPLAWRPGLAIALALVLLRVLTRPRAAWRAVAAFPVVMVRAVVSVLVWFEYRTTRRRRARGTEPGGLFLMVSERVAPVLPRSDTLREADASGDSRPFITRGFASLCLIALVTPAVLWWAMQRWPATEFGRNAADSFRWWNDLEVELGAAPVHAGFVDEPAMEVDPERPAPPPARAWRWYLGQMAITFGTDADVPVAADFDGDGRLDPAVFTPESGVWTALLDGRSVRVATLGKPGDVPLPGRYSDGVGDVAAVYRPESGRWIMQRRPVVQLGGDGDVPVPADYDGDGLTDPAVFRPETGEWLVANHEPVRFGTDGDVPVPGRYSDAGVTNVAVYRPLTRELLAPGIDAVTIGSATDVPVVADFDGDGLDEVAMYRASVGRWIFAERPDLTSRRHARPLPGDWDGDGDAEAVVVALAEASD